MTRAQIAAMPAETQAQVDAGIYCRGSSDGDCFWADCPQIRDGEPHKTGRHCPIDTRDEDDE